MKIRNAVSLKPKPGGSGSAEQADLEVDLVDVAVVDLADLLGPLRVLGEVLEALDPRLAQLLAEVVVARHAALAVAQDVDRAEVDAVAVERVVAVAAPAGGCAA